MQEQLVVYAQDPAANPKRWGVRRFSVYVGFAVLLAAASLVAVNGPDGSSSRFPRVLVPGSGASCTTPPNGFLFSQTVDGAQLNVCISQQGNINQIQYPDTAAGHTQIAFDGYWFFDNDTLLAYRDYSPASGITSAGFGPATLTQTTSNQLSMIRNTTDGRYQLTQFIKINFQPRSIFVGMTVKNIDPANVTHHIAAGRTVAPALDGSAADDQYNEYGGSFDGRTGHAFQSPGPGTNSLLFGPTQSSGWVWSCTVANVQAGNPVSGIGCYEYDPPGYVGGGNRAFVGHSSSVVIPPNESRNVGKFVYRML